MQRGFTFALNEFYHLYSRGTDKRVIFKNAKDYNRFVHLLYLCNGTTPIVYKTLSRNDILSVERGEHLIDIGAYCLMPNHFHILAHERTKNGISMFMRKLLTGYSMYFNKRYERTGSLFESAFKARHADTDRYLKYLFAYIHLNPAKILDPNWRTNINVGRKNIYTYVSTYEYSSFPDYLSKKRQERVILTKNAFPDYFVKEGDAERNLLDWLTGYAVSKD